MWTSLVSAVSNRTFFMDLRTLEGRAIQYLSFLNILVMVVPTGNDFRKGEIIGELNGSVWRESFTT